MTLSKHIKSAEKYASIPDFKDMLMSMKNDCLDDITEDIKNYNLWVAKIREYNRVWNEMKKVHPYIKIDGFKMYMKSLFVIDDKVDKDLLPLYRAISYL
jgi:hypothetical protein